MGQLDVYSLDDISLISILSGPVATYLSSEIDESIESIAVYVYSSNVWLSKKRKSLLKKVKVLSLNGGSVYRTWNFFNLNKKFIAQISPSVDEKIMWQDPQLSQWEGAEKRQRWSRLQTKYAW